MPRCRGSAAEIGLHQQREAGAVDTVADPGLGAVDDIAFAVAARGDADRLQVGAAIGLGQRQAAAQLAGGEARQELALLRLGAVALHDRRHDQVRVENAGQRHPHARDALDDLGIGRAGQAEPAIRRADRRAEQPELAHAGDDGLGVDVVVLQLVHDAARHRAPGMRRSESRIRVSVMLRPPPHPASPPPGAERGVLCASCRHRALLMFAADAGSLGIVPGDDAYAFIQPRADILR